MSIVLHILVLLFLILSFEWTSTIPVVENSDQNAKIISAIAMDVPTPPAPQPPAPIAQPKPAVQQVPPQTVAQPKPQVSEKVPEKQHEVVVKKPDAIALKENKKKKLVEEKSLIAKQLLADLKKQAIKDKKAKQKMLEQAMEKELKEQTAKSLQQQLLSEQKRATGAKMQGEVNKYKALILQAISQRWLVPPGVDKHLSSELLIRLAPGGDVLDVQITKSSGDVALDRSARDAVFKASPLPVPAEAQAFDSFRQFVLRVKPESIVEG